jgi:pimeloyl-ACP methyl ester carboxylesterase
VISRLHRAPVANQDRVLLVMLPGIGINAADFTKRGFVAAVHERGIPVDVITACPELDLYFAGTVGTAIHREIIEPAHRAGYSRIWFLAISLGGMGALLYASAHADNIEGLILLAPFLATQGTIKEIAETGGLAYWSPDGSAATPAERRLLAWLKDYFARQRERPALYLGYGLADRFGSGHMMLSSRLPAERVVAVDGGHDWETWAELWPRLLDARPFSQSEAGKS